VLIDDGKRIPLEVRERMRRGRISISYLHTNDQSFGVGVDQADPPYDIAIQRRPLPFARRPWMIPTTSVGRITCSQGRRPSRQYKYDREQQRGAEGNTQCARQTKPSTSQETCCRPKKSTSFGMPSPPFDNGSLHRPKHLGLYSRPCQHLSAMEPDGDRDRA